MMDEIGCQRTANTNTVEDEWAIGQTTPTQWRRSGPEVNQRKHCGGGVGQRSANANTVKGEWARGQPTQTQ